MEFGPGVAHLQNEGAYAVLADATALEAQGKNIVHFEIGQPDYPTPDYIVDAGVKALEGGKTTYCNPSGIVDLKTAIANHVTASRGVDVTADMVVVGPGCKPGLFFTALALVQPGDEIIGPDPGFPSYTNMAHMVGAKPVQVRLNAAGGAYDMDALEAAITDKTRIILVNSPSNPTGAVQTMDELTALARLVQRWPRVWVFSDEIYAQLVYDMRIAPSYLKAAAAVGVLDRCVMFDGASKTYCMTGWRLGWSVMPKALCDKVHLVMVHAVGCTANFTQAAGVVAVGGDDAFIRKLVADYKDRRDYVVKRLNTMPGITCASPAGAFYVFPNVNGTVCHLDLKTQVTDTKFLRLLLEYPLKYTSSTTKIVKEQELDVSIDVGLDI
eukprot:m.93616 g.93616  ORF g.93616 m.93616 type:complete len:383 (-) comp16532_c0_seq22:503-1651(-)